MSLRPTRIEWTRSLFACAALCLFQGCTNESPTSAPVSQSTFTPGIYRALPPGIDSVRGECTGKIALTPAKSDAKFAVQPYPLMYDCASKTFKILKSRTTSMFVYDLTLTERGYYMHQSVLGPGVRQGKYVFYDWNGNETGALLRPDHVKVHDTIVHPNHVTYIRYVPDADSANCDRRAPLELQLVTENREGKVQWSWTSKGRFDPSQRVPTGTSRESAAVNERIPWYRSVRHCYTSIARRIVNFAIPKWHLWRGKFPVLQLEQDDYVHANSIQWIEPSGDILVSAKHLDTVFLINRQTGNLKWALGGKFATVTSNRPVDDPRGGFSHPHFARLYGTILWVLDNGNLSGNSPSRAVAYQVDAQSSRRVFEFQEPNGKRRASFGSVQLLEKDQLLIGWGSVEPADQNAAQRVASIVRLSDARELFSIDLAPGWMSYRVKAMQ